MRRGRPYLQVKDVRCTPIQATILLAFGKQRRWTLAALAEQLQMAPDAARKKLTHWTNRGYVIEAARGADGELAYEAPAALGAGPDGAAVAAEDDDTAGGGDGAEAQLEQVRREITARLHTNCRVTTY